MSKTYPQVEREPLIQNAKRDRNKRCSVCQAPATRRIVIETSWFRGEDEIAGYLCDRHGKKYRSNAARQASEPNPDYVTDAAIVGGALTGGRRG